MTVAALILAPTSDLALADTLGQPRVRRLADIAWAGGALPVVVVAPDPDGLVARALAETEAIVADPGGAAGAGARVVRGMEAAAAEVRDVSAALVWPAAMSWAGAETVTSLIEAHGVDPGAVLRAAWDGRPGWPMLVPFDRIDALRDLPGDADIDVLARALESAGGMRSVDLGDPGSVFDAATAEADLPPYEGPPIPAGGHVHEWGEDLAAADDADEVPGEGRALSPYPQAAPGGPTDT